MKHELLTTEETANLLRVTVKTVQRMIGRGDLPAVKVGNRWRVKAASLALQLGVSNGD